MKKKWLLLLIIAFPSFFWLILETSTINSRRLPIYGPKKTIAEGDTVFYTVPDRFFASLEDTVLSQLETKEFPLYAIGFVSPQYRKDAYRLTGVWEYLNYKKDKVRHIPFVIVTPSENGFSLPLNELRKLSESPNLFFYTLPQKEFDKMVKTYFREKPYYIDYSFFLLIDAQRRIRGYYDGRYVSEIKRLIEEYKHLRLKEEKQILIKENEIRTE